MKKLFMVLAMLSLVLVINAQPGHQNIAEEFANNLSEEITGYIFSSETFEEEGRTDIILYSETLTFFRARIAFTKIIKEYRDVEIIETWKPFEGGYITAYDIQETPYILYGVWYERSPETIAVSVVDITFYTD